MPSKYSTKNKKFRDVPIGERFFFASNLIHSACVKLTARTYRIESDGMKCTVGSINAEVQDGSAYWGKSHA